MPASADREAEPLIVTAGPIQEAGLPPPILASSRRAWRVLLGLLGVLVGVGLLAHALRPELEVIGRAFVARFGLLGVALGTFLADGFHFPVPPQFYMLLGIASKSDPRAILTAIALGSIAGGTTGFCLARRLSQVPWVARWLERSSRVVTRFVSGEHGFRLILIASFTPIAFSALCYLAGLWRIQKRHFAILALTRIPKLVLYYYIVRLGWGLGL